MAWALIFVAYPNNAGDSKKHPIIPQKKASPA